MKKFVGTVIFSCILLLTGCQSRSGYIDELTGYAWQAEFKGGGQVSLTFSGDTASLHLENGGESETIEGKFLADQSQLIIFDPSLGQNYGFDYMPQGDTLLLGMNGSTVTLEKQK